MSEKIKAMIKQVDDAFATGSIEDFYSLCSDDVVWEMAGEKTAKGLSAIREWMGSMGDMPFPKLFDTVVIAEGDRASAFGQMTMQNEEGGEDSYDYCDIYRFQNDKIVELRSFVVKKKTDS